MTAPDYAARAAAGAAFLDEQLPDWAERIDLDMLALYSECDCILGQLEGYREMRDYFGLDLRAAAALGFALNPCDADWHGEGTEGWDQLDTAWTAEIKARCEAAQVTS